MSYAWIPFKQQCTFLFETSIDQVCIVVICHHTAIRDHSPCHLLAFTNATATVIAIASSIWHLWLVDLLHILPRLHIHILAGSWKPHHSYIYITNPSPVLHFTEMLTRMVVEMSVVLLSHQVNSPIKCETFMNIWNLKIYFS